MSGAKRSPEELVAASAHLHYEVTMFDATARALMMCVVGEGAARNAFLESFTIHTRALLQFFHPSGSNASDVLAEHFFGDRMNWLRIRGRLPNALSDVEHRVGNEIAHLSYERLAIGPDAKKWNVPEIWKAVMGLVATFVANVPPHLMSSEWSPSAPAEGAGIPPYTAASTESFRPVVINVNSPVVTGPFLGRAGHMASVMSNK